MLHFKDYIEQLYLKEALSYTYRVPKSLEKQMVDFYVWTIFYQMRGKTSVRQHLFGGNTAQDLQSIPVESAEKIVERQYRNVWVAGLASIFSEFSHSISWIKSRNFQNILLRKGIIKKIDEFPELWRTINDFSTLEASEWSDFANWLEKIKIDFTGGKQGTIASPKILTRGLKSKQGKKYFKSPEHFVKFAIDIFRLDWKTQAFGGIAWADIAEGWLELNRAKSINDRILAIDHMYDLQHNSGFALNKLKDFRGDWVLSTLERKRRLSLENLFRFSTIPSRVFYMMANYYEIPIKSDDGYFKEEWEKYFKGRGFASDLENIVHRMGLSDERAFHGNMFKTKYEVWLKSIDSSKDMIAVQDFTSALASRLALGSFGVENIVNDVLDNQFPLLIHTYRDDGLSTGNVAAKVKAHVTSKQFNKIKGVETYVAETDYVELSATQKIHDFEELIKRKLIRGKKVSSVMKGLFIDGTFAGADVINHREPGFDIIWEVIFKVLNDFTDNFKPFNDDEKKLMKTVLKRKKGDTHMKKGVAFWIHMK